MGATDCEVIKKPPDLVDGPVVVKMKYQKEDSLPQTLKVEMVNGKIHMNVTNTGQGELHIYKVQNIGEIDLRLAGSFHITGDSIQRCLPERLIFSNEKETQDYFSLMHISDDKTLQGNTRLDLRKTPIDETEKN